MTRRRTGVPVKSYTSHPFCVPGARIRNFILPNERANNVKWNNSFVIGESEYNNCSEQPRTTNSLLIRPCVGSLSPARAVQRTRTIHFYFKANLEAEADAVTSASPVPQTSPFKALQPISYHILQRKLILFCIFC